MNDTIAALLIIALGASGAQAAHSDDRATQPERVTEADRPLWGTDAYERYAGWADGESPTSSPAELDAIFAPRRGMIEIPLLDELIDGVLDWSAELEAKTGLRIGFAYTTIFQQASGGAGRRRGASGDLDIMTAWTLVGRGTQNTGQLIFSAEERHAFGPDPASALRGTLGTLHPPTNGFNDRGLVIRDLYWIQRLMDGKLGFAIGRGDTSDFFGGHGMQSLNISFSNRSLSANTVIPSPGHGIFGGFSVRPSENFFLTAGIANAYGNTTTNDLSLLDEESFFSFGEFGYTPTIESLGSGRYRAVLWHIDSRDKRSPSPNDFGFSLIADQNLGERLQAFARYGYADDGGVTNIRWSAEAGLGVRGLLGSPDNMTGLAFAYTAPKRSSAKDEKVLECFHRFQLSRHTQLSLGVQGVFDPSNANPEKDAVAVFTTRFRVVF